jgi:hypothetical protein
MIIAAVFAATRVHADRPLYLVLEANGLVHDAKRSLIHLALQETKTRVGEGALGGRRAATKKEAKRWLGRSQAGQSTFESCADEAGSTGSLSRANKLPFTAMVPSPPAREIFRPRSRAFYPPLAQCREPSPEPCTAGRCSFFLAASPPLHYYLPSLRTLQGNNTLLLLPLSDPLRLRRDFDFQFCFQICAFGKAK